MLWLQTDTTEVKLRRSVGLKKDEYQLNRKTITCVLLPVWAKALEHQASFKKGRAPAQMQGRHWCTCPEMHATNARNAAHSEHRPGLPWQQDSVTSDCHVVDWPPHGRSLSALVDTVRHAGAWR